MHLINFENIYKLFTKEDSMNLHKILGSIVLMNFIYRYSHFFYKGNMNFTSIIDVFILFLHGILSISSLVFHISNTRNPQQPMIYPEYRMHSIVFTLRSVACCLVFFYNYHFIYTIIICASTILSADLITIYYNYSGKNGKTMRNMPFDNSISFKEQNKITFMQSCSQIGATLYMFGNIDSAFSPLFAIQLAAFLMTMVRKGIIDSYMWHFIYSLSLWINYILITSFTPGYFVLLQILFNFHCFVIFHYRIHKYIAWTIHFLFIYYFKELLIENAIDEYVLINYNDEWRTFTFIFTIIYYFFMFYNYKYLFVDFFAEKKVEKQITFLDEEEIKKNE